MDRVIFVDDDRNVLQGLRRALRDKSFAWELYFAESGDEALTLMTRVAPDVVVSDMRMPRMNGAELLARVRERHPGSARIILSGYADRESVIRTVGPAHQFLAKPCDNATLIATVARALGLRRHLASPGLRRLVAGLRHLPSTPATYTDLVAEIESPTASARSVAGLIGRDVAMTAAILKLTNSAFFSTVGKVADPLRAVQILGFETLRSLVLFSGIFAQFEGRPELAADLETISRRSLQIGMLARRIGAAEHFERLIIDQACCAGLLAHVGLLVLIANTTDGGLRREPGGGSDGLKEEWRAFGATHAELGAYLLGLWGFADPIVEAVAFHHQPSASGRSSVDAITLVHVAQHLTRSTAAEGRNPITAPLDEAHLEKIGALPRLPAWETLARDTAG